VTVRRVEAEKVVEILCDEINIYLYDLEDGRFFVADAWDASRDRDGTLGPGRDTKRQRWVGHLIFYREWTHKNG